MNPNPLTSLDYPDVDVIRVEDCYYMVSTTMHFFPGCEILRSYDLVNWEHAAYVYDMLDDTPAQRLEDGNIYGMGMWAATLRYHQGLFYLLFVANDTRKTYLFTAKSVESVWDRREVEGFYHDASLLFDDDGCAYIAYGNRDVWLTQLRPDLSGPLSGGLHRIIVSDTGNPYLGYEGAHMYKLFGRYYVFLIHSRRDRWMRTQACFSADRLDGEFAGGDILEDDRGFAGQGVAQGGIVDTPEGLWYSVLFQDLGAAGRIPILVPLRWENGFPVLGEGGKIPEHITVKSNRLDYVYQPLVGSDDFRCATGNPARPLRPRWQFNHQPRLSDLALDTENGRLTLTANHLCNGLLSAPNTITQRMRFPECAAEVTLDGSALTDGSTAGLCVLQGCYAYAALTRREGKLWMIMASRSPDHPEAEQECIPADSGIIRLRCAADFRGLRDEVRFYVDDGTGFRPIGGVHKLYYKLDHFAGARFGLFHYATAEAGGKAVFSAFDYL